MWDIFHLCVTPLLISDFHMKKQIRKWALQKAIWRYLKTADAGCLNLSTPLYQDGMMNNVPENRAYEIERVIQNGKLKYNPTLYQHSSTGKAQLTTTHTESE